MCGVPILQEKSIGCPAKGNYGQGLTSSVDVLSNQQQAMLESTSVKLKVFNIGCGTLSAASLWDAYHHLLCGSYICHPGRLSRDITDFEAACAVSHVCSCYGGL